MDADRELAELQRSVATQGHAAGLPGGVADPEAVATWEQRRAAQREAYGQFVALGPIHIGNALAFHTGQQVPLEHVIRYGLEDQELVARVATPELARVGKVFATDDEYRKANPHVAKRVGPLPEAQPTALDPRGGAAHLDTEGKHGEVVAPAPVPAGAPEKTEASTSKTSRRGEKQEG